MLGKLGGASLVPADEGAWPLSGSVGFFIDVVAAPAEEGSDCGPQPFWFGSQVGGFIKRRFALT